MENEQDIKNEIRKSRRKGLADRLAALRERANLLELELKKYTQDYFRVCIFGSARIKHDDETYKLTHRIAEKFGAEGVDVLTGGGPGLMEAANKGVLAGREQSGSKSKSFGITIQLNAFEPKGEHLDITHHHRKFSSRLDDFMLLSNAIVVVQGGIGTLLELFYTWQLVQVKHMSDRPIILVDRQFWGGLIEWMKNKPVSRGLLNLDEMRWLHIVDTPEEVLEIVLAERKKFLEDKILLQESLEKQSSFK